MKNLYGFLGLGMCISLIWFFPSVLPSSKKSSFRIGGCFTLQIQPEKAKDCSLALPAQAILRIEIPTKPLREGLNWHIIVPLNEVLSLKNQGVSKKNNKKEQVTFLEFECGSSGYSEVFWRYTNLKKKGQNSVLHVEIMPPVY